MKTFGIHSANLLLALTLGTGHAWAFEGTSLRQGFHPVRHQGRRNTCSAFAAGSLLEFIFNQDQPGSTPPLSPNWIYWSSKNLLQDSAQLNELYRSIDGQAGYRALLSVKSGIVAESSWPYFERNAAQFNTPECSAHLAPLPSTCFTGAPPAGLTPLNEPRLERLKWDWIPRKQISAYITTKRRPVLVNIQWYTQAVDTNGAIRAINEQEIKECQEQKKNCSGHVILLTGYDPKAQRFEFRNSWGPSWGNQGYGTIPEEHILNHCETCYQRHGTRVGLDSLTPHPESPEGSELHYRASFGISAHIE